MHYANDPGDTSTLIPGIQKTQTEAKELRRVEVRDVYRENEDLGRQPAWFEAIWPKLEEFSYFPPDWDSYGAPPINENRIVQGLNLLAKVMRDDTPPPIPVALSSGAVQFEWHERRIDLEIEILGRDRFNADYEDSQSDEGFELSDSTDLEALRRVIAILSTRS